MTRMLKRCPSDGRYTLKGSCPGCGKPTKSAHPVKYSKEDRYAEYRRRELYGNA
ncbi:MAG: nucleolar RNA-binding Nop10p family protein [Candidatus Micrarchaeota archaeon]